MEETDGCTRITRRYGSVAPGWPTRKTAVLLALRHYGRELSRNRLVALPALLLPALGNVCQLYLAPLIVAELVDQREAAIARVSGHVADSLMNMETVRAFAAENHEAAEHKTRVAEARMLAIRSGDYANLRIDTVVTPMLVLTNALGLFSPSASPVDSSVWRRSW